MKMQNLTNAIVLYRCTDEGKQITLNHLEQEELKRKATENAKFEYLSKKRIRRSS